jgi:tRNA (mo5U34)-methyltransferase
VRTPDPDQARRFIDSSQFVWFHKMELAPGVLTPGVSDIGWLAGAAGLPDDLSGTSVLDIGTANGGAAFLAERRGATDVVAVDIYPPSWFGMDRLIELFDSGVQFVQASLYELPEVLGRPFDLVLCWGVLYHLRHPLLGLDALRRLTGARCSLETAVADREVGSDQPVARFYRRDELSGDGSNWWAPTTTALSEMLGSCGFEVSRLLPVPPGEPASRAICELVPADPEWPGICYEVPLRGVRLEG